MTTNVPKSISDNVLAVLKYIDSPFKLVVVLLLGVVGYAGYFWHQNSGVIVGAYLKSKERPSLDASRFDDISAVIFKRTGADTVSIFSVDPLFNRRVSVRAYSKDGGREQKVEGINVGLFTNDQKNNLDVVALIAGEVPCSAYTLPQSEIGLWYIAQNVKYTCRVSVPPEINRFVGQITVGWSKKPAAKNMAMIDSVLKISARALTKKQ